MDILKILRMNFERTSKIFEQLLKGVKNFKYAEEHGKVEARLEYNIPESTLRDWIQNKSKF